MHIPKGKPVHENLKTSYLNATALLADLQIDSFTGYLQAVFPHSKGNIFLANGIILNAVDESLDRLRRGEEAIDAILLRSSSPDGKISVYSHTYKTIEAIAGRIEGEIVYQALDSDFTDLKKLVEKLKQQDSLRFYIEVEFSDFGDGVIYVIDGEVDGVLSLASGEVIEGLAAYEKVLSLVLEKSATFHVYRCAKIVINPQSDNVLSFPEVSSTITKLSPKINEEPLVQIDQKEIVEIVEITSKEVGIAESVEVAGVAQTLEPTELEEEIKEVESQDVNETPSEKELPVDNKEDLSQKKSEELSPIDEDYQTILGIMTEIIQIVERVSLLVSKEANFPVAFRSGLLKITEEYPVFDPFAEDFSYQDGKIHLTTLIPKALLINGLTKALKYTLDELVRMSPNSQLRERIIGALLRLEQLKQREFEVFSISSALAELITIE
ncbi:MAG: hypothetical protein HY819_02430 [Acidobacteria bacterium]|nr:hypothetical protein [Acidobacteriota bacterium]